MGEVRVTVKLTNAIDEALARRGQLDAGHVRTYKVDALVDTGTVRCILPQHVVQALGLQLLGRRVAQYADGRLDAVGLTEPFTLHVMGREELETAMVLGDEVILGQMALEKLDLVADCANQRLNCFWSVAPRWWRMTLMCGRPTGNAHWGMGVTFP